MAAQLDAFYRSMAKTARDGLRYSLSDNGSYRSTGAEMLKVLTGLRAVDAASRTLAGTVEPRAAAGRPARAVVAALRGMRPSAGSGQGAPVTEAA